MKAELLVRQRIVIATDQFSELVLWKVPKPIEGSRHAYKYRLAFVAAQECVVRYDNERGKGDHRHYAGRESAYRFVDVDKLLVDFMRDIERWRDENGNS